MGINAGRLRAGYEASPDPPLARRVGVDVPKLEYHERYAQGLLDRRVSPVDEK